MSNWRNRPQFIEHWPDSVKHVMFIDESGNSSLNDIQNKLASNTPICEHERYFTVTGCVISRDEFSNVKEEIIKLKKKYWPDGKHLYRNKLKRVCFHSREIRRRSGPFSMSVIDYDPFISDLTYFIKSLPITIFSSTIDKEAHCRIYSNPYHPYDLCMEFVMERFVKYFLGPSSKGIVMLEARGTREDRLVLRHIKRIVDHGTLYAENKYFKKISGVYFNPKWCKQSNEQKSYFGLEIADLCCYPIYKFNRSGSQDLAYEAIENKIHSYPYIEGKGIKVFPKI